MLVHWVSTTIVYTDCLTNKPSIMYLRLSIRSEKHGWCEGRFVRISFLKRLSTIVSVEWAPKQGTSRGKRITTFEKLKCTSIRIITTLSRDNYVSVISRLVHGLLAILYRLIKNFRSARNKETRVESTHFPATFKWRHRLRGTIQVL